MRSAILAIFLVAIAACSENDGLSQNDREFIASEIKSARAKNEEMSKSIAALESRIQSLEAAGNNNFKDWASIDPGAGSAYGISYSNAIPVPISFDSATQVADGSRVKLYIGNLFASTFSGAELTVRYNRRIPATGDGVDAWNASLRTATTKVTSSLVPGAWNAVTISLPGIKPDELGYMSVKVDLDVISLRQPATP